jgi:hypothetical protein
MGITLVSMDYLALPCIHLLGDSKVVIDWLSKKGRLQVSSLEGWKARILSLSGKFQFITFQHIYRNFNTEADKLSKQAIDDTEGTLSYHRWTNGAAGPRRQFRIH